MANPVIPQRKSPTTSEFIQRKKIGELFIESGLVSREQVDNALGRQKTLRKRLGEILLEDKSITEEGLYRTLAKQFGIDFVELSKIEIDKGLLKSIPENLVKSFQFVPLKKEKNSLTIIIHDPTNAKMFQSIQAAGFLFIKYVVTTREQMLQYLEVLFRPKNTLDALDVQEILDDVKVETANIYESQQIVGGGTTATKTNLEELKKEGDQTAVVTLVNKLILNGVRERASDIHLEIFENFLQIRFRIDGLLYDKMQIEVAAHQAIVSRIKIMANQDITERMMPQDGSFKLKIKNQDIEFRVSILPSVYGENITIRVLNISNVNLDLKNLGFAPGDIEVFMTNIAKPWGLAIMVGPTGSGKTTTLYSAISLINTRQKKIITIEDPVEYKLGGIHQMQVNENKNDEHRSLTFSRGLRAILRQDPDIIMVGEIRDYETAEITVKAALTGHMVFSTLHANTAVEAVARLDNLGIDPYLFASSLNLLVGQRLVRRICQHCRVRVETTELLCKSLGVDFLQFRTHSFYKGTGCGDCNNTGFLGRIGLYEVIGIDEELRDMIASRETTLNMTKYLKRKGFRNIMDMGLMKVLDGIIPVEEFINMSLMY